MPQVSGGMTTSLAHGVPSYPFLTSNWTMLLIPTRKTPTLKRRAPCFDTVKTRAHATKWFVINALSVLPRALIKTLSLYKTLYLQRCLKI